MSQRTPSLPPPPPPPRRSTPSAGQASASTPGQPGHVGAGLRGAGWQVQGASGAPGAVPVPQRGGRDTPSRMRLVSAALVVVGLLVGLAAGQSFFAADRALGRASDNAAQLVRLQEIQVSLVRADADATNAFLVGGLEPVEQRQDYDQAVARASELVAYAARAQAADGDALAALNAAIQDYVATIQLARANNRQAFPVGAQYLKNASSGLREVALPLLGALEEANRARAEAEFSTARLSWVAGVTAAVLGLGGVAVASVWLARRTHRYLNVPVVGAAVVILVVLVASAVVLGSVAGTVGRVQDGSYAASRALSDARTAAFDAKSNESLTLISRGSGAAFEEAWAASADTTSSRLSDAVDLGDVSADLQASWSSYADLHVQIRTLDDAGSWDEAVAAATSREDGSANAAFTSFDVSSGQELADESDATSTALRGAGSGLAVGAWLAIVAGLLAAVLAWRGLSERIEEYR
jgi:hypothetical protein